MKNENLEREKKIRKHRTDKKKLILSLIKNQKYTVLFSVTYLGSGMNGTLIEYDEHRIFYGKDSGLWLHINFSFGYSKMWVHYSNIETITINTTIGNYK